MSATSSKPTPARPLVEVNSVGLRALVDALGVADTARFLHQYGPGRGDYTAERDGLLGDPSLDEAVAWVRRQSGNPES
ncbi:MAG: hypothetical protein Rubg2KO_25160 [Rubricoccaceae bacterium]